MKKQVRVIKFKEIITEVECINVGKDCWVPKDIDYLGDLLNDFGDNYHFEYEVLD